MSIDKALVRIEYKLDLIIRALQSSGAMLPRLDTLADYKVDVCPLCEQVSKTEIDLKSEQIYRVCGCRMPEVVPGISNLFTPPESEEHYGNRVRSERDEVPSDEEADGGSHGGRAAPASPGDR